MAKLKNKPLTEDLIKVHLTKHKGYIDTSVSYEKWKKADKLGSSVTFSV